MYDISQEALDRLSDEMTEDDIESLFKFTRIGEGETVPIGPGDLEALIKSIHLIGREEYQKIQNEVMDKIMD